MRRYGSAFASALPPDGVVVANNLAVDFKLVSNGAFTLVGITPKHNYTFDSPTGMFGTFDVKSGSFDLHLRLPHGVAENGEKIPPVDRDIDGPARASRTELGA
jgi:hypothetical protein